MILTRRAALLGIGAALATPAIVRAESLMKIVVAPKPHLITLDEIVRPILDEQMACVERDLAAAMSDAALYGTVVWRIGPDGMHHHVPLAELRYAKGTITIDRPGTEIGIGIPFAQSTDPKIIV